MKQSLRMQDKDRFWPIVGIMAGWGIAILLVPEFGYHELGALMPAGIAMCLGILFGVVLAVSRQVDSIFEIEYILVFGVVFWLVLDAAQGAYAMWGISRDAILVVFHSAAIFSLAIWVGSAVSHRWRAVPKISFHVPFSAELIFYTLLACFFFGMLSVFLACRFSPACIVEGLLSPRFHSPWQTMEIPGLNPTIMLRVKLVGYLILPLTIVLHHMQRRLDWRVVLGFTLSVVFLMMLVQGGGRRQVGMVLGASVMTWMMLNRPLTVRRLIKAGVALIVLTMIMQAMITWRNYGFGQMFSDAVVEEEYDRPGFIHVDKNLYYFGLLGDIVPDRHDYTGWRGVYSIAASSIPRTLIPGKPEYNVIPLRDYLPNRMGWGWSWTCSAVCEFYLIGGYTVVGIGGFVFGVLAQFGNHLLRERQSLQNVLIYGVYVMTLFISLRALRELTIIGLVVAAIYAVFFLRRVLIRRWHLLSGY